MRMTVPRFLDDEARHGSLVRGALRARRRRGRGAPAPGPGFVALRGGLETLTRRLASLLPPGTLRTGSPVQRLTRDGAGWRLATPDGEVAAAAVILACPGYAAARMLAAHDLELAGLLSGLHYASCAIVNLVYRRADLARPLDSFGFFVPRTAGLPILACSHVSEKFGGRVAPDRVLLRVFLGGAVRPEVLDRGDADLARLSHDVLRDLLAIRGEPLLLTIRRHPRSMPQHPVGDQERVDRAVARAAAHPGLELCGSLVGAIGLPDCIRTGEAAARGVVAMLSAEEHARARAASELARP
jgi:oxygen-dependent protoporphyrinogen oxidase